MSSVESDSLRSSLRPLQRHVTTHDSKGYGIFSDMVSSEAPVRQSTGAMEFSLMYTNQHDPLRIADDADIKAYTPFLKSPPALTIPGGTVCRTVDFAPGYTSPMHRTVSLDFGVVLEGEVELQLDSGEKRLLKRGDVAVQRGTNHAWRNTSKDQWCRMFYVLQAAESLTVAGKALVEDEGGID